MLNHTFARTIAVGALVLTLGACATTSSRPVRSEFEDIPVPRGLALVEDRSTVIESPSVKAARLIYRGRVEPSSLAVAMRQTLEANGWRSLSTTAWSPVGTMQVYEKGGNTLQVRVWEEWYYTYVEMTASRALATGTTARQ